MSGKRLVKLISLLLSVMMFVTILPVGTLAESLVPPTTQEQPLPEEPAAPAEEPKEDAPADAPAEQSEGDGSAPAAPPAEEPAEQPSEEPTEQPTEEPAEEPTEQPTEQPVEQPAEEPEVILYKVRFIVGDVIRIKEVKAGEKVAAPSIPEAPEGKEFDGWYVKDSSDSDPFDFDTLIEKDIDLVARFKDVEVEEIEFYTITVKYRVADGGAAAPADYSAKHRGGWLYDNTVSSPKLEGYVASSNVVVFSARLRHNETATVTYTKVAQAPVVEEPVIDEPNEPAEQPAEQPTTDEPAEEPKADEPVEQPAEEPTVDEPAEQPAEQPKADEPAEEPTVDEPAEQPAEEPTVDEPADEPAETVYYKVEIRFVKQTADELDQPLNETFLTLSTTQAAGTTATYNVPNVKGFAAAQETVEVKEIAADFALEVIYTENKDAAWEDDAEEPVAEEPVVEEPTHPAQSFTQVVGGKRVSMSAPEGSLPAGTTMVARAVGTSAAKEAVECSLDENQEVKEIVAIDITLYGPDGSEVQPLIPVKVTFTNVAMSGQTGVYHVSGSSAHKVGSGSGNVATATANSFSVYVIVTIDEKQASYIYELAQYYVRYNSNLSANSQKQDSNTYTLTQIQNSEALALGNQFVAEGKAAGKVFLYWTSKKNNYAANEIYQPGSAIPEGLFNKGNRFCDLYAQWADEGTITYTAVGGGSVSPAAETVAQGQTTTAIGSTATATTGNVFMGWYSDAACTTAVASGWVASQKITPVAPAAGWTASVTYYAKFVPSSYTVTATIDHGTITAPATGSTKVNYNDGTTVTWTVVAGYSVTEVTDNGTAITPMPVGSHSLSNVTADHAIVVTTTANIDTAYKVEHYLQDLNVAGTAAAETYTLQDTENKTGTTGEQTAAAAKDTTTGAYLGFTAGTVTQEAIAGDGSTVVEIYYTRNSYKLTYEYTGTTPAGASTLPNGGSYLYGAAITAAAAATAPGYDFGGWTDEPATMPAADTTVHGAFTEKGHVTITYRTANATMGLVSNPADSTATGATFSESVAPATGTANGSTAAANTGYHFVNWTKEATQVGASEAYAPVKNTDGIYEAATYVANFAANTNTAYKVEHYQQDLNADGTAAATYTLKDTDSTLIGTTGAAANYSSKTYTGFAYDATQTIWTGKAAADTTPYILADGTLVIKLYYTRNSYGYSIEYYYDGTKDANLTYTAGGNQLFGSAIDGSLIPASGTGSIAGNTKQNYYYTGTDFPTPATISATASANVIKVNYAKMGTIEVRLTDKSSTWTGNVQNLEDATVSAPTGVTAPRLADLNISYTSNSTAFSGAADVGEYPVTMAGDATVTIGGKPYTVTYVGATLTINPIVTYHANKPGTTNVTGMPNPLTENGTYNQAYTTASAPSCTGYVFRGWDTNAAGTTVVYAAGAQTAALTANLDLYAVWTAATDTKYTVEYYQQKLDDPTAYTKVATLTPDGTTNGTASFTTDYDAATKVNGFVRFTYDHTTFADSAHTTAQTDALTIAADGSLVIRLYYNRNLYTVTTIVTNGSITSQVGTETKETHSGDATAVSQATSYLYGTDIAVTWAPKSSDYYIESITHGNTTLADSRTSETITGITTNHTITVVYAQKTELVVTSNTPASWVYDGIQHSDGGYTAPALKSGDTLMMPAASSGKTALAASGTITTPGTKKNTLPAATAITVLRNGVDVTKEYTIRTVEGDLTVTKRPVNIYADSKEQSYTGQPLTAGTYTVGTGANEGPVGSDRLDSVTMTADSTITQPGTQPNKINGWSLTNGSEYYVVIKHDGTLTVHPVVTYDANTTDTTLSGMPSPLKDTTAKLNVDYTVSSAAPTRTTMVFNGWNTQENGSGMAFAAGSTITAISNNVTLYAQWTTPPVIYYRVAYLPGAANVGNMPAETNAIYAAGQTYTVSNMTPTRDGYVFNGWYSDNLANTRRYVGRAGTITIPTNTSLMVDNAVFLTARWTAVEPVQYTATYTVSVVNAAGATVETYTFATYTRAEGVAVPNPGTPARAGYTFSGWAGVRAVMPAFDYTVTGTLRETATVTPEPTATATPEPTAVPLETIEDDGTPLAGPRGAAWALLNLILAIVTALASVLMLIGYFGKKKDEDENGVQLREIKRHGAGRLATLIPGIGGIIAFILTENMRNPMVFTDKWTLLMAVIALIQLGIVLLSLKSEKDVDPTDVNI